MTAQHPAPTIAAHILRTLVALLLTLSSTDLVFAQANSTPEQATKSFYEWYLKELSADKDPFSNDPSAIKAQVSAPLIRQIDLKRRSPDGMDADYFIQAQDYLDDWLNRVAVKPGRITRTTARVDTTLGEKPQEMHRLRVTLVREAGVWKIRQVQALPP